MYRVITKVFDYGENICQLKISLKKDVVVKNLKKESFTFIVNETPTVIKNVFFEDGEIIIDLEVKSSYDHLKTLTFDSKTFISEYKEFNFSLVLNEDLFDQFGSIIKIDLTFEKIENYQLDLFGSGTLNGINYRDYSFESLEQRPLVLVLHGAGEGGLSNYNQIAANKLAVRFLEEDVREILDEPYILAPQCKTFWVPYGSYDYDYTPDLLMVLKEYVRLKNVDPSRIYVVGASMGGYQALKLLIADSSTFKSAMVICPAQLFKEEELTKIKDVKVALYHVKDDNIVPFSNSLKTYEYLKGRIDTVFYEYDEVLVDGEQKLSSHACWVLALKEKSGFDFLK